MMSKRNQAIAALTAAVFAFATTGSTPAFAGTAPQAKAAAAEQAATEFSSRNRHRAYPRYRNDAAAAAMVGAIVSGITAYAAAREYRKARERTYYGYGPYYGYRPHYRSHGYPRYQSHGYSRYQSHGTSSYVPR